MGNIHSQERRLQRDNTFNRMIHRAGSQHYQLSQLKRKTSKISRMREEVSSRATSPGLSRSSSTSLSRPTSVIGDVKDCVQKFLGRSSSALDVSTTHIVTPRISFSAPAELLSDDIIACNDDDMTIKSCNNRYCLPIDEQEQDRLTNTHYVLKYCFGGNFSAPVNDLLSGCPTTNSAMTTVSETTTSAPASVSPSIVSSSSSSSIKNCWTNTPTRVLDLACGSGVWVLEMATAFPHSQFYGVDIATIYPNSIKPPNTQFQHCDILDPEGLPYPDGYFDYVHMRLVYNCFSKSDLKIVLNEINRVLKPGGYLEMRDIDPIIKNTGPTTDKIFSSFADRISQLYSVDVTWTSHLSDILLNEGEFTDIHQQKISVGFGFKGPLATSIDSSIADALRSYKQFFMQAYDLSSTECDAIISSIIQESSEHRSYFNYYMGWARKPLVLDRLVTNNNNNNSSSNSISTVLDPLSPITTTDIDYTVMTNSGGSMPVTPSTTHSSIYVPQITPINSNANPCIISVSPTSSTELLDSAMIENAFDIVHLTYGFTE
ncbi:MAG: hypothetical protein EXX96DRAFT_498351 [Benjaminiella poitrasii]|nr:MAG: hypothetical protein EXX96DRAFT_498351 [Benjaminiella poitrasii]